MTAFTPEIEVVGSFGTRSGKQPAGLPFEAQGKPALLGGGAALE